MISPNSVFGLLKDNLYNVIVPLIIAAFLWMAVGVLDNECEKSKSVSFVKTAHIVMGILATVYSGAQIVKLTPYGRFVRFV